MFLWLPRIHHRVSGLAWAPASCGQELKLRRLGEKSGSTSAPELGHLVLTGAVRALPFPAPSEGQLRQKCLLAIE